MTADPSRHLSPGITQAGCPTSNDPGQPQQDACNAGGRENGQHSDLETEDCGRSSDRENERRYIYAGNCRRIELKAKAFYLIGLPEQRMQREPDRQIED